MTLLESLGAIELGPIVATDAGQDESVEGFKLETQREDNWCWAAVAVSIARHRNSLVIPTQCRVVELALPCDDCEDALSDLPGDVVKALDLQGIRAVPRPTAQPILDDVLEELRHERPVICKVRKEPDEKDSLPHFVVIVRARRNHAKVKVVDPAKEPFFALEWKLKRFARHCLEHYFLT